MRSKLQDIHVVKINSTIVATEDEQSAVGECRSVIGANAWSATGGSALLELKGDCVRSR